MACIIMNEVLAFITSSVRSNNYRGARSEKHTKTSVICHHKMAGKGLYNGSPNGRIDRQTDWLWLTDGWTRDVAAATDDGDGEHRPVYTDPALLST